MRRHPVKTPENSPIPSSRVLSITDYRNVGVHDADHIDHTQKLILNRSLNSDELGGLVILIGLNNCGKSNVLRAVERHGSIKYSKEEYNNWVDDPRPPVLRMELQYENKRLNQISPGKMTLFDVLLEILEQGSSRLAYERGTYSKKMNYDAFVDSLSQNRDADAVFMVEKILERRFDAERGIVKTIRSILEPAKSLDILKDYESSVDSTGKTIPAENGFENIFGYNISNNVVKYAHDNEYTQKDFISSITEPNRFMKRLLKILGFSISKLTNAIDDVGDIKLDGVEEDINIELKKLSRKFNQFFKEQTKQYDFKIRLSHEKAIFAIRSRPITTKKSNPYTGCNLDNQSVGFHWLFDFFIDIVSGNELKPGDIVLMDEFGDRINFSTIRDLGIELRALARKTGLTFVLATQNPVVINTNYLDEVRLVIPEDSRDAVIINDFTQFSSNPDIIQPILSSMTIGRNFIREPDRKTIFVTEPELYFCLSAFARMMPGHNLDFLPVNGIGSDMSDPTDIIRMLHRNEIDPILITSDTELYRDLCDTEDTWGEVHIKLFSELLPGTDSIFEVLSENDRRRFLGDSPDFNRLATFSHQIDLIFEKMDSESAENISKVISALAEPKFGRGN